jgi:DNA-binding protein
MLTMWQIAFVLFQRIEAVGKANSSNKCVMFRIFIVAIQFARERQVNVRVVSTGNAIEESVDLAYEIFNRVFRKVPEKIDGR